MERKEYRDERFAELDRLIAEGPPELSAEQERVRSEQRAARDKRRLEAARQQAAYPRKRAKLVPRTPREEGGA